MTLSPERQSARMSKITNDGLIRSGTGCFIYSCTHTVTVGVKGYSRGPQLMGVAPCPLLSIMFSILTKKRKAIEER